MRAITVQTFGGPDALEIVELPVPEPGPGQVRIRVAAAPAQPVDVGTRAGNYASFLPELDRYTFGWDVAGTVDALGPGADGFAVGDAVIGLSDWFAHQAGTQAEYVVLPATALAVPPAGVSLVDASTLPLNAQTALQALGELGLSAGDTLAVTGAAGAVGAFAVELAARRGLRVAAIAGPQDEKLVRALGAEWFVPRSDDPASAVREVVPGGVDGLFDPALVGAPALAAVRDGGVYLNAASPLAPAGERGISTGGVKVRSDGAQLADLVALVEQGALTLRVAGTYAFEDAVTVHELLAKGGIRGRLVYVP
jgi:NADPH:quinone reductase-like Zn-dependent oxidoreductase